MKYSQRKKEETLRTVHLDQKFTTADLNFSPKEKHRSMCCLFTINPENHCITNDAAKAFKGTEFI